MTSLGSVYPVGFIYLICWEVASYEILGFRPYFSRSVVSCRRGEKYGVLLMCYTILWLLNDIHAVHYFISKARETGSHVSAL